MKFRTLMLFATIGLSLNAAETGKAAFNKNVKPFLNKYCTDCHDNDTQKGDISLHNISDNPATKDAASWVKVLEQLMVQDMPPRKKKQPEDLERASVIYWIQQELDGTPEIDIFNKMLQKPDYGNYVSHQKLFSGEIKTKPFSPSRIWRLSPEVFNHNRKHRLNQSPYTYNTPTRGIRDYSATSGVDQSSVQMMMLNIKQILEQKVQKKQYANFADDKPMPSEKILRNTINSEFYYALQRQPTAEEHEKYYNFLKKNIAVGGNLAGLKTTVTAMFLSSEAIYRMELGQGAKDKYGRRRLSPEEIANSLAYALTNHAPSRHRDIKEALAQKKLQTKADVTAVLDKMLKTENAYQQTPRIQRFFEEFFSYHLAGAVFKDDARVRSEGIVQFRSVRLVNEARLFIEHFLKSDKDVISGILTSDKYFVAHVGDNKWAKELYEKNITAALKPDYIDMKVKEKEKTLEKQKVERGSKKWNETVRKERVWYENIVKRIKKNIANGMVNFPGIPWGRGQVGQGDLMYIGSYNLKSSGNNEPQRWSWMMEQPMQMPKGTRAGLLTHPAWLAAYSVNDGNDPVRRGLWVWKRLLAGPISDIPPDVDANVPNDPHKTLRERMTPLRDKKCWACHYKMNPFGEPFEIYDDWGRYRDKLYFDDKKELLHDRTGKFKSLKNKNLLSTKPVNATGEIHSTGEAAVDGKVVNAVDMMNRLGKSTRARQSFIRHMFRYFMGRNERLSDSQTLIEADKAYVDNGGSFKALLVSLLTSDSFLYRK